MQLTDVTPNIIVADMDRSLAFYRDVLGFSTVATVPDQGPFVFAWMTRNATRATDFFDIPPNRVVELGAQIEL